MPILSIFIIKRKKKFLMECWMREITSFKLHHLTTHASLYLIFSSIEEFNDFPFVSRFLEML